ncbi:hypothetical protein POM88_045126 [Heracleum sosnowskyi]|uniref:Uncharacterized protein n=1 Tax=Heracleum sosnowskyi TaxID=360622 RepID=A0AAD8H403_9APIA|nr:hypothetical protein POM88_045126 [Heracleum sosnowskyi]
MASSDAQTQDAPNVTHSLTHAPNLHSGELLGGSGPMVIETEVSSPPIPTTGIISKLEQIDEVAKLKGILKSSTSVLGTKKKVDVEGFQLVENKNNKKKRRHSPSISLVGVLETKVRDYNDNACFRAVHNFWNWDANYQFNRKDRIWVGWNSQIWNVFVVYRFQLWKDIASLDTQQLPWSVLDDFNTIQDLSETSGVSEVRTNDMQVFKDFLVHNGLADVHSTGPHHTWCNKQINMPITRKLDRILGDPVWMLTQQNSDVLFMSWGLSDHCAAILNISDRGQGGKAQTCKMKLLSLQAHSGPINVQVKDIRDRLCSVQELILDGNAGTDLYLEEKALSNELWDVLEIEESIAHQ